MNKPILSVKNLHKTFLDSGTRVDVLKDLSLDLEAGRSIAIMGPSGSGKTTLLQLLGGLDTPDSGNIIIDSHALSDLNEKELCKLRNEKLGFIYQFHHLLPEFTALENTMMPLLIRGDAILSAKEKAIAILNKVGLSHRLEHKPSQLSGGERQRTAIARALITNPLCVLADEPTGNLDKQTAEHVYELIFNLKKEMNTSFIVATHDIHLAQKMDAIYVMEDGAVTLSSQ